MEMSYAMTVHKSQGSELSGVVLSLSVAENAEAKLS